MPYCGLNESGMGKSLCDGGNDGIESGGSAPGIGRDGVFTHAEEVKDVKFQVYRFGLHIFDELYKLARRFYNKMLENWDIVRNMHSDSRNP